MKETFILQEKADMQFYIIPAFTATGLVSHGFTTRHGGVSSSPYDTLNLAFHVGDQQADVVENRKRVAAALDFAPEKLVTAEQVHGDRIMSVTAEHAGRGAADYATAITATDALITNVPGIPLATFYADCVPVMILDPVQRAIGLAHAGWKGTVQKIAQKTVCRMSEIFGTQPADCLVGIAPSIGPCCYEVDERVYGEFSRAFTGGDGFLQPKEMGRWQLDLWAANLDQLLETGVRQENVVISRICTNCNRNQLFSYRGDSGQTGRMGAFMMLKQ